MGLPDVPCVDGGVRGPYNVPPADEIQIVSPAAKPEVPAELWVAIDIAPLFAAAEQAVALATAEAALVAVPPFLMQYWAAEA